MLQSLVNRFTVLGIEEYTDNDNDLSNISVCPSAITVVFAKCSKWKKLSLYSIINVLNIHKISLYISISLETTDTAKSVSVHILVNSGTTEIFIHIVYRYEF